MRVVVGPVSTESAHAWLGHARGIIEDLDSTAPDECFTAPDVLAAFDNYLTEWEQAAETTSPFLWECDLPTEEAEYHLHAFQKVAELFAHRRSIGAASPPPEEAKDFRVAVLQGVLSALAAEGPASAEFAQHLGQFWPDQERLPL